MVRIRVRTSGGEYPVHVGRDIYQGELKGQLENLRPERVSLVSHDAVMRLHGARIEAALKTALAGKDGVIKFLFPEGEEHKNLRTLEEGYLALLAGGMGREDVLVAFGGGVVGDLAGFLAATYMRGIAYVQVPTTLMAMVDSAVGGKVGVDLPGAKNAVGAFHQPRAVFCDVAVLGTLPEREMRSGLVEVAKYGFLYEPELVRTLQGWGYPMSPREDQLEQVVAACVGHKARVVGRDERDLGGIRAMLNYGHTFGHALESACGYGSLSHGEAVAVGMIAAARLAELAGVARGDITAMHLEVLTRVLGGRAPKVEVDPERVLRDMEADKKKGGRLRFVLLEGPQKPRLVEGVAEGMVKKALQEALDIIRGMEG